MDRTQQAGSDSMSEYALHRPRPPLAGLVPRCVGYLARGFPPGVHLGLPSPYLTVVLSLGAETRVGFSRTGVSGFMAVASGLAARPAYVEHDGHQHGLQLELTPAGARALLGVPAAELADRLVPLECLLGPAADRLLDELAGTRGWPERFRRLDDALLRRLRRGPSAGPVPTEAGRAWSSLLATGGRVRVADLAADVGWSRRHLAARFRGELGVSPKQAARIVRFDRARWALQSGVTSVADVAAACGYYDQAHLDRDWAELAGVPPTTWLRAEQLPLFQDDDGHDEVL